MTKLLFILFFVVNVHAKETHEIVMKSISYDPKVLTIKIGDSVDWINKSLTPHSAIADDGKAFDTGTVDPQNRTKKIEFTKAGTYPYHCAVHGMTMHASIVVQ